MTTEDQKQMDKTRRIRSRKKPRHRGEIQVIIRGFMTAEDEKCKQMENTKRKRRREKSRIS